MSTKLANFMSNIRFDLQLEERVVNVGVLWEMAITQNITGWTDDREKQKHKIFDAVVRALFVNKYKDLVYCLPAQILI